MARSHFPGRKSAEGAQAQPSASLVEAIDGLTQAVALLTERLAPAEPPPPSPGAGSGRHLRVVPHRSHRGRSHQALPIEQLPVSALRAQLRRAPIDRTSLPAPIEYLRQAELIEALRQVEDLQGGGGRP
jgi:hypothetical protein